MSTEDARRWGWSSPPMQVAVVRAESPSGSRGRLYGAGGRSGSFGVQRNVLDGLECGGGIHDVWRVGKPGGSGNDEAT